jgi:uncharacterized membrane protein (UPF0127 family)
LCECVRENQNPSKNHLKNESYVVFNRTRGIGLADAAETARSVLKRMKGLIGHSAEEFIPGKAFWIVPSEGIHTFGMRFPIDAVYLDSKGKVLKLYHSLAPYRFAAVMLKAHSVLELPPGTLAPTGTQVGDMLEFRAR